MEMHTMDAAANALGTSKEVLTKKEILNAICTVIDKS
jgi:hypothetical protein